MQRAAVRLREAERKARGVIWTADKERYASRRPSTFLASPSSAAKPARASSRLNGKPERTAWPGGLQHHSVRRPAPPDLSLTGDTWAAPLQLL
jgi:hypothetical protein